MKPNIRLFSGVAVAVLCIAAGPAFAQTASTPVPANAAPAPQGAPSQSTPPQGASAPVQTAPPPPSATVSTVVVTGFRASLQSAQNIKRNADQIVDSIVAADIGKLPDINTAEALQRVPGVQITRDLGEGSTVAVRGLTQVETTLNGHEIFTAAGGRTLNFEDLPSELLAGVDVYKSQSANLIEGGLGGSIDVHTHKPFDFKGPEVDGDIMANYGDLIHQTEPQGSLLVSDRWNTGIGEIGALVSLSYQKRDFREDYVSGASPILTHFNGANYQTPNGTYDPLYTGNRVRDGLDSVLQWRPNSNLEFYTEFNYNSEMTQEYIYGTTIPTVSGLQLTGAPTTYPGTNIAQSETFRNAELNTFGTNRSLNDVNKQFSVGGKWDKGPFTVKSDFSYSWASENLYYTELDADQQVPTFTQNTGTAIPAVSVTGPNLLNPANYSVGGLTDSINHYAGDEKAFSIDGEYRADWGPISAIDVGFRWAETSETFNPIRYYDSPYSTSGAGNIPITNFSNLYEQVPYQIFTRTNGNVPELRNFIVANPKALGNIGSVLSELGFSGGPTTSPLSIFNIDENTYGGYFMVKYAFDLGLPVDGNVGVRVVGTDDHLVGNETNLNGSGYVPINQTDNYIDALPSLNARVKLQDDLFLRLGAYKSLTRPDFSNLSPSLTLLPSNLVGNSGNPELQPMRADNVDLSLEWYFTRTSSITAAAFYKRVTGFPLTVGVQQPINGQTYVISEPQNSGAGEIKGGEIGYQQFFSFLPGLLSGLGAQANFTYVDSSVPSSVSGFSSQLPNLSRYQYNLVGIYEKGPFSARVAYNWRSSFVSAIYVGPVGVGVLPEDTKGFGWLDAAVNYNINSHLTLSLEASNLLQTKRQGYYSTPNLPYFSEIDDRQVLAGLHFHF